MILSGRALLPGLRIVVWVTWERWFLAPLPAERRRINVNARTGDIARRQRAADLDDMPARTGGYDSRTHAAMDLFVVPTIGFDLLYALVIVRLARRDLVWINVTTRPTADWIARQITEAFPWAEAPRYLIRDRDCVYGAAVTYRLRAMGIRDKPIAPG